MTDAAGGTPNSIGKVVGASFIGTPLITVSPETFQKDIYADDPEERALVAEQNA